MTSASQICVLTLAVMRAVATRKLSPDACFEHSIKSLSQLHEAGVPFLTGTDSYQRRQAPAGFAHVKTFVEGLGLLSRFAMSNLEVLQTATIMSARCFGWRDRGMIELAKRPDLVLISGNPLEDWQGPRTVEAIWCSGVMRSIQ